MDQGVKGEMVATAGEGAGAFKEHEGTGMGEGEGAKDVSDKIENEDQLLGAQKQGGEEQQVRIMAIWSLSFSIWPIRQLLNGSAIQAAASVSST